MYPFTSLCKTDFKDHAIFLIKEIAGMGGGHVVFESDINDKLLSGSEYYYQEYIKGIVYSAVFLANGKEAKLIGINQHLKPSQISSKPFLYEGAITTNLQKDKKEEIDSIINKLTKITKLFGLCGLDFIIDESNNIYVIDVNPRPPSTFELHENEYSLFAAHIDCFQGKLPRNVSYNCNKIHGHAIYYAKKDLFRAPNFPNWVKDIPRMKLKNNDLQIQDMISAGNPVCSVYAEANTLDEVKNLLFHRLQEIELSIKSTNKL